MLIESQPSVLGYPGRMPMLAGCVKSSSAISCRVVPEETKGLNGCKDTAGDDTWDDIPLVVTCSHAEAGLILMMLVGD